MISAPVALARQTVNAYARYRDADVHHMSPGDRADFFEKAQELFRKLVRAMECRPDEERMVSENIAHMVHGMAPSMKPPKRPIRTYST